jgi:peptide chain release factor 3
LLTKVTIGMSRNRQTSKSFNLLDTPGHEDFAEDTYRTLTAVDSVIIVIDGAKGVESQTRKLMEVCRMRSTPVIVFINKLDRPSKEPFDLLDEVEKELHIRVRPLAFPISNGPTFKGVYNLYEKNLSLFTSDEKLTADASTAEISDLASQELEGYIGEKFAAQLRSDVELVEGVYDEFDREAYLRGELAPVFFGSAVNNFGVRELLECFVRIAPSPRPAPTETRQVEPAEPKMTGFVFKIHANMDPNHRDRIAFLKICSGTFERNRNYLHVRSGKQLKFSSPTAFMAEKKSVIDFAYPGDIVGLHDTGNFKIGDTFTEGEKLKFTGIPSFAPEQFRYIENADPLKFKQLAKGVDQLMDEGVAQLFTSSLNGRKIIGTVGALQFEVIEYRLAHEYNAACRWEPISIYKACWIDSDNAAQLADFKRRKHTNMAVDKHGRDVFLADTSYGLALAQENFKVDLTIARGLDYYTGTVYETRMLDHPEIGAICAGGRYDNLAEYYSDRSLPGVGVAIGLTRLFYVLDEQGMLNPDLLTAPADVLLLPMTDDFTAAVELATRFRNAGLRTQLYSEQKKFKAKMTYADRLGIPYVVFLGEDEIAQGVCSVKDLRTGQQVSLSPDEAVELIRKGISELNKGSSYFRDNL